MTNATKAKARGIQPRRDIMDDMAVFARRGVVEGGGSRTVKLGFEVDLVRGKELDLDTLCRVIDESLKEAKLNTHDMVVGIMFRIEPSDNVRTLDVETYGEIDFKEQPELVRELGKGLIALKAILERRFSKLELELKWQR